MPDHSKGSGKTTLLNLIGCLDRPTSGSLRVAGVDSYDMSRTEAADFRGKNLGFIFQDFNLGPVLTVDSGDGWLLHCKAKTNTVDYDQLRINSARSFFSLAKDGLWMYIM